MAVSPPVSIDQRFAQLIQQFGLTKNSFAISLGKTASVIQHLIDGRNKPGYDLLCKVFEIYPNVSRDWLLLGRGPMLVSGEPTSRAASAAPATAATPAPGAPAEAPLEPIDLSDIHAAPARRNGAGVAGSRLQPADIAATLALAAATHPAAQTTFSVPLPQPEATPEEPASAPVVAMPAPVAVPAPETVAPPIAATQPVAAAPLPAAEPVSAPAAPTPVPVAQVSAALAASATPPPAPETYVTAALHAQHLQHQLALAEMRNQHLLEQQQMLREMLTMARQSMV